MKAPAGAIPGRGSLTWRYGADWRAVLTSRAVLMLQGAHPVVGAGVADHSEFLEDRWGRLIRTVKSAHSFLGFNGEESGRLEAARLQTEVVDRAMQVFGAMGITPDTPLSYLWTWGRALRFIDGPDEVHLRNVARAELAAATARLGSREVAA